MEAYEKVCDVIALEYAYRLSKLGIKPEDENWEIFEYMMLTIGIGGPVYVNARNILEAELKKPVYVYGMIKDTSLTDYEGAQYHWNLLKEFATAYLNDMDIPEEEKEWVSAYIQRAPYQNMCDRLQEKGLDAFGNSLD